MAINDTIKEIRTSLLRLRPEERVGVFLGLDICLNCGEDIVVWAKAAGVPVDHYQCHCDNDE